MYLTGFSHADGHKSPQENGRKGIAFNAPAVSQIGHRIDDPCTVANTY